MPLAKLPHIELSYLDEGEGPVIILIHGFASTKEMNWVGPNWVNSLTNAGYRVIALDNRGHGESTKLYDAAQYSLDQMASDVITLMDHLGIKAAHIMGYSMGARISCVLAMEHPGRCNQIVLGGNGYGMIEGAGDWNPVRDALLADSVADVTDPRGRAFRLFADQTKSDRKALAACVTGVRQLLDEAAVAQISNDVLIAVGSKDDIAGSGERLAKLIPGSTYVEIPNRDHMRAVGDKVFIEAVLEFLPS